MKYKIVRDYLEQPDRPLVTIRRGVTLVEAQRHCSDPQTSSSTCTNAVGRKRTHENGRWYDGYSVDAGSKH